MCYGSKQLSQPLRAQPRSLLTGLQADLMRFMTTAWDAGRRLRQQAGLSCAPNMQMGAMLAEYRLALAMAGVRSEGWPRQQAELQCSILKSDGFYSRRGVCGAHGTALLSSKPASTASGHGLPMTGILRQQQRLQKPPALSCTGTTWIMKPCGRAQGRGIFLLDKLSQVGCCRASRQHAGLLQSRSRMVFWDCHRMPH